MADISYDPNASLLPKARDLWNSGRRDEALEHFLKVQKEQPKNLAAILAAARALGSSYRFKDAERLLGRLKAHRRKFPILNLMMGQVYREIRRPELALKHFRAFVDEVPDSVDGIMELAQCLERFGFNGEALYWVTKGMQLSANNPVLEVFHARLLRDNGNIGEAEAAYNKLLDRGGEVSAGIRSRIYKELAQLLDETFPEQALAYVAKSNSLREGDRNELLQSNAQMIKRTIEFSKDLTSDFLAIQRKKLQKSEIRRLIFMIGFPRSGTTLLEKLLSSATELNDAEELDLFGLYINPLLSGSLDQIDADDERASKVVNYLRRRYIERMREYFEGDGDGVILDKNPSNTLLCSSMARVFPEAKFLVMLRDPRDVLLSAYFQFLPINPESVSFLDWERLVGHYVETMSAWLRLRCLLPTDMYCEVRYESLVENPERTINDVCGQLGLGSDKQVDAVEGYVSSPSYSAVRSLIGSGRVARWELPGYSEMFGDKVMLKLRPLMNALGY